VSDESNTQTAGTASATPTALIVAIWTIALIPLAWGFINTVMRALKLFA